MSVIRSALAAAEVTVAVVGIAITVSRHPLFRAAVRAAPQVMPPTLRDAAAGAVLDVAYQAGVMARRIVPRGLVE